MANDHYALLVTINHYPGLSDLKGPENDGHAFEKWLCDPNGGGMDNERVRHICSSNYVPPATDPDHANPTEQELKRALNGWLRNGDTWRDRVGGRLYLYFAGHGFTGGSSNNDPALFTAGARQGDTAHIAGYRYASKIVNAGFFDEVLLIMDCCQDVMKGSQVIEPTWAPPDRNSAANVKFLQVYGAPRGRKAFEDSFNGGVRGLLSTVLVDALTEADADAQGWVSGNALKTKLLQLWKDRFQSRTLYHPPVHLPAGEDIQLYLRAAPLPPQSTSLGDEFQDGTSLGEKFQEGIETTHYTPLRNAATFVAADVGLDIVVLDEQFVQVGAGAGVLTLALEDGLYTVMAQAPGATSEIKFEMQGEELQLDLPVPAIKSSAPFKNAGTCLPWYFQMDEQWVSIPPYGFMNVDDAQLFVMVRCRQQDRLAGLRIVGLTDSTEIEFASNSRVLHGSSREAVYLKAFVPAASYALIFTDDVENSMLLPVYAGWRTEIYFDWPDNSLVPDFTDVAIFVTPENKPSPLENSFARSTELARLRLMNGWNVSQPTAEQAADAPLLALFAAYSAATAASPDRGRVKDSLDMLPPILRETMADALLLDRWCQHTTEPQLGWFPLLPTFSAGWQLMTLMPSANEDNSLAMEAIGQWRLAGSVWTYWQQPQEKAALLRRRLRRAGLVDELDSDAGMPVVVLMRPAWGLDAWRNVRDGMSMPVPGHSPFQQALRRRILDCLVEDETDNPVDALAATFGLTPKLAIQAYNELYVQVLATSLRQRGVEA
jgi:hypothetical protein